jgi:hypothetical protein
MLNKDNFRGFSLFNDVKDPELKQRNRAQVLVNIAQDNTRDQRISGKGAGLILGYFGLISPDDRADVQERFTQLMVKSGFIVTPAGV